jgi:hypothetical protein
MLRLALIFLPAVGLLAEALQPARWSEAAANEWYAKQPWLVGGNYLPADAINDLEVWQADTFDSKRIDKELGWGQKIGMSTMRVFLQDQFCSLR